MYKTKYLILIESLLMICGCSSKQLNNDIYVTDIPEPSIEINHNCPVTDLGIQLDAFDRDFFHQCVDDFELVPLETTDECLIGNISDMVLVNDTLVIADRGKAQKIFLFDLKGKFIRSIGTKGEGPDEYGSINNISFDDNNIMVNDWTRDQFITYDLSGTIIDRQMLNHSCPHNIIKINDTIFAGSFASYDVKRPYAIEWIDRNDSVTATARPYRYKRGLPAGSFLKTSNGQILYYRSDSDTIFEISPDNIKPVYALGINIDYDALMHETGCLDDKEFNKRLYGNDNMPINYFNIIDLDNHWLLTVQKGTKCYVILYDIATKKSKTFLRTDLSERECLIPFITYRGGCDLMLSNISQSFVEMIPKSERNKIYESINKPDLKSTVENYDFDNNNPIVCLIKLKKQ